MLAIWSRASRSPGTCKYVLHKYRTTTWTICGRKGDIDQYQSARAMSQTTHGTSVVNPSLGNEIRKHSARVDADVEERSSFGPRNEKSLEEEISDEGGSRSRDGAGFSRRHRGTTFMEDLPDNLDWNVIRQLVGMELSQHPPLRHDHANTLWNELSFDSRLPGSVRLEWPANTGWQLQRYNLPPQSLWAPDSMRLTATRKRHTRKKLALQELSIGLLIHRIIGRMSYTQRFWSDRHSLEKLSPLLVDMAFHTRSQTTQAQGELLTRINQLQEIDVNDFELSDANVKMTSNNLAIPQYYQDADGDFYDICQQLNGSIKHLLQMSNGNDGNQALIATKICHNLLISTAPPDVQTLNILLSGFRRWQRPILVDDVIAAFYGAKIRPNEITCSEILGHYAFEGRSDDFSRFVAKMCGVGDALMLANPTISVNEASQGRLIRISETKIYQKVHASPLVFTALIDGALKFAGFERALDMYYEMKEAGWGLDMRALIKLLRDCIDRADWDGGMYVWAEIESIKSQAKPCDISKSYYHLLSLCSIANKTVVFNRIVSELAENSFDSMSIINAATKLTLQAQKKKEYLAPAWAADNVLIAVSAYMADAKAAANISETKRSDGEDTASLVPDSEPEQPFEQGLSGHAKSIQAVDPTPESLWEAWLEKELGEGPKDQKIR